MLEAKAAENKLNGSVNADFSLLPDEDAALTFVSGDAPKGYCYKDMTISFNQKEGFCWTGSFYIMNTAYKSAEAIVIATCTWIPCGEGGGSGVPPPPITGTGIGTAVAQPGTYWNSAEGNNVLALGGTAEVFAFKDDGEFADSTWSHSAKLSFKEENLISVKTVGEDASDSAWDSKVHSVSHDYPDLSDDEPFTVVSVFSIEAEPEVVCVGHEHIAYTITTRPEGFNHMVSYTPADTSTPGIKEVVATCGTSAATTTVTVIKVEITPASMNVTESLDSGTFTCTVTPSGMNPTYQWLTGESEGAWPSGVGNNPELDYSAPTASSTKVKETRWFANPDDRHWLVTGSTCTYSINCEVTVNGVSCRAQSPAQLVVTADASGSTSWPQFSGVGTIQVSTKLVGTNTEWYVSGQGSFSRTAPVKTIDVPATSQFYNKVDAHESKHVTQWTSESPWKDLFDANALYASILESLTSQTSEADLRNKINQTVATKEAADAQVGVDTLCDREIAAFAVDRGVEPHYQELDDSEVPGVYGCTPSNP